MRSIELRWFYERDLSDAVLRDFDEHGRLEVREDLYLWGTGDALGVKLREGQLETKRRDRVESLSFDVHGLPLAGIVEHWEKRIEPRAASHEDRWVAVGKSRALRMLTHTRVELTRVELRPDEGLALRGPARQFSLALEVGAGAELQPIALLRADLIKLAKLLAKLLGRAAPSDRLEFGDGWPGGYPAWLARSLAPKSDDRRIAPP